MALINRVSRLFTADLHAVLDRIEEPELLLRQAVREMEEALGREERRLRVLDVERQQIAGKIRQVGDALTVIEEELDLCFESGKEDLARGLVRRKLETGRRQKALARQQARCDEEYAALSARIGEDRDRLEAMRQKAEAFCEGSDETVASEGFTTDDFGIRDEDVEVAFLREQSKRGAK